MAVFSIIKLSELEGAKRIDAEYYKPEYLKLSSKIISKGSSKLGNISSLLTDGDHGNPEYSTEGIPYVTSENLNELGVDIKGCNKISYEYAKKIRKDCFTTEGNILLTTVGKIGISTIAQLSGIALSRDIARIIIRKNTFYPEFISVYLNSRIGLLLTERESVGSVQKGLYLVQIRNLKIPKISNILQNRIKQIFLNAIKSYKQSLFFYSQAENLLLEELGLKDFKPKYEKTYTAKLSDVFSAHRIDAEYFQPAYEEVSKMIKEYPNGFSRLLKHVENVNPNFDPTKYPEQTFSYVELADIDSSIGVIHSVNDLKGEEAPSRARRLLKEGDVIVSSVEGSLEKVALVDKEHNGCLASTGFFQFRPLDILPEVLLVLSKTIVLQSQLKKKCSGTILTAVPKESLRDIIIPILPLSTQQKIALLVQQSHEARRKAKELLEVAKKAVEIAIEKNEKEALDYISKSIKKS